MGRKFAKKKNVNEDAGDTTISPKHLESKAL